MLYFFEKKERQFFEYFWRSEMRADHVPPSLVPTSSRQQLLVSPFFRSIASDLFRREKRSNSERNWRSATMRCWNEITKKKRWSYFFQVFLKTVRVHVIAQINFLFVFLSFLSSYRGFGSNKGVSICIRRQTDHASSCSKCIEMNDNTTDTPVRFI